LTFKDKRRKITKNKRVNLPALNKYLLTNFISITLLISGEWLRDSRRSGRWSLDSACLGESAGGGEDGDTGFWMLDAGFLLLEGIIKKLSDSGFHQNDSF
jgi:hypothetical protein